MAEVLGLVASGFSVAQVAGSLVTGSLKLKALLDEVKNAPETLRDMLDQLELLTPILCEATAEGNDATSTSASRLPAHSRVQKALRNALRACQTASEQLEFLTTDLMSQVDMARGGVRRKRAMVKVVLKKGTLAQYETRLQKTIQLLTLAQNTYIIAVQRTQPEAIVSQLMSALAQPPQDALTHTERSKDEASSALVTTTRQNRRPKRRSSSALEKCVQFGFARVTGRIQIHTLSKDESAQTTVSASSQFLRIQLQMPTWLCTSMLDAALSRSYSGWTCSLNVYGALVYNSEVYKLAMGAIKIDDVNSIRRLFEERHCGPRDQLWHPYWGFGGTLTQHAMSEGAWQVSTYLLDYDAEYNTHFDYGQHEIGTAKMGTHFENFLMHDELNEEVRITLMAHFPEDLNRYTNLVGRLWPDNGFYDAALEDRRFDLALSLLRSMDWTSSAICRHLFSSISLPEASCEATRRVLSSLAQGLGQTVWHDPDSASQWQSLSLTIALQLNKAFMMPAQRSSTERMFLFSPLGNLLATSLYALPVPSSDRKRIRQHKMRGRLANCEKAARIWLNILYECGIDLLEYGKQEKQWLDEQERGCGFGTYRDGLQDESVDNKFVNGCFEIMLIGFKFGSQPEDWKLWWSEPTDELAGDFWREMDPEAVTLCIPGSWVEDED